MSITVFIDGAEGTTGLEIRERLAGRDDIALVKLDESKRKDVAARTEAINSSDFVILCLPDDAAREAVALIDNGRTRVIDASTAHRVADGWTYGFPELEPGQSMAIAEAARVSNPGCYPTGFLALVRPLVRAGLVPADWPITVNAISPGFFVTEMTRPVLSNPEAFQRFRSNIPMARFGEPRELVTACLFLSSPASSYVTGADIVVDGGWLAH